MNEEDSLKNLAGWYDLEPEQLEKYKQLRSAEISAKKATHEYLNSLLPKPLDPEERRKNLRSASG